VVGIIVSIRKIKTAKRKLADSENNRTEQVQGEKRILDFLHHLGVSIYQDNTHQKLYEVIVDGVCEVTKAKGGALYLLDEGSDLLRPVYITKDCAQLVPNPITKDPDKVKTKLRMDKVNKHEGILGHALSINSAFATDSLKAHPAFLDQMVHYSGEGAAMIAPLIHADKQIGVLAVTKDEGKNAFSRDALYTFTQVAEQSSFAIGNFDAHDQAAEKKRMEEELENAQEVQRVLLPNEAPEVSGFKFYGYNVAAKRVSGDYYDYTETADKSTGVIIADVSGKGVPAGLIMATFRSALKAISTNFRSPAESLCKLNRMIYPDIRDDMFISAIYAHFYDESGKVTLARAGHNPAYYYSADKKEIHLIKPPGLAVGIDNGDVFDTLIKDHEITMQPGDKLLLYTDGIIEANNAEKEEFSSARLADIIQNNGMLSAKELGKLILSKVEAFVEDAPQSDDITLVVIERK